MPCRRSTVGQSKSSCFIYLAASPPFISRRSQSLPYKSLSSFITLSKFQVYQTYRSRRYNHTNRLAQLAESRLRPDCCFDASLLFWSLLSQSFWYRSSALTAMGLSLPLSPLSPVPRWSLWLMTSLLTRAVLYNFVTAPLWRIHGFRMPRSRCITDAVFWIRRGIILMEKEKGRKRREKKMRWWSPCRSFIVPSFRQYLYQCSFLIESAIMPGLIVHLRVLEIGRTNET